MSCSRCNGLCIQDYVEESGRFFAVGRCVNCGSIVFPASYEQKTMPAKPRQTKTGSVSKLRAPRLKKVLIEKICA